jgi:hypothetical protein
MVTPTTEASLVALVGAAAVGQGTRVVTATLA